MHSLRFAQVLTAIIGAFYTLTGAALLFAPRWFYEVVAPFPPYNQHFIGDAGSFALALGIGPLLAARDPRRHAGLIAVAALASAIHLGNHLYDDIFVDRGASLRWLSNSVPLFFLALLAVAAWLGLRRADDQGRQAKADPQA